MGHPSLRRAALRLVALTTAFVAVAATSLALTTAPADAAVAGCGSAVYKASGDRWTCTFADNFYGTTLNRKKWYPVTTAETGYSINKDCFFDSDQNIRVREGVLKLIARRTASPFRCASPDGAYTSSFTGGSLSSVGRFSQTYGRFEMRAKFPTTKIPGTHSAWWLWAERPLFGGWPYAGEIDIAEYYSKFPDRSIPYIHYIIRDDAESSGVTNYACMLKDPTQFHTYTLDWDRTSFTISYDGKTCLRHTIQPALGIAGLLALGEPFAQPFTLGLTQGVGVNGNSPTSRTRFPVSMSVDYVRVWS